MVIGNSDAIVDGNTVKLDAAPKVVNDRTFVPLRFVAESLNTDVSYDGNSEIIIILQK
jgi:hypothetical protein